MMLNIKPKATFNGCGCCRSKEYEVLNFSPLIIICSECGEELNINNFEVWED